MPYRRDVQILRGIAVLLVVFFHLGVGGFDSGFLGVDVFFVISGYLMAAMYDPDRKLVFFKRRAKRLLPTYFAVLLISVIAASIITTPNDYEQVERQAWFATVFASNFGFWFQTTYFDKAVFTPLLHLWSLGVEIQFYLIVPIIYWLAIRSRAMFVAVALTSAVLCFVVVGISPKTAFFMLPFRLWEFMAGFGIALYLPHLANRRLAAFSALGAIALTAVVCIPLLKVDGLAKSVLHGHPGVTALFICVATAVVIAFGIPKLLEYNPVSAGLERVGHYSYSIYLVHFPLIVFVLYQPFSGTILKASNANLTALLTLLLVGLSILLFTFVEKPFRAGRQSTRWIAAGAILVLVVSSLGTAVQSALIPKKEMLLYQAWFDRKEFRCGRLLRIVHPGAVTCLITNQLPAPAHRILLVGNSYADSIKATFAAAAEARNVEVYFVVENEPLMQIGLMSPEGLVKEAKARHADGIVLHYSPGALDVAILTRLIELAQADGLQVSFIMPPPVYGQSVPAMLWQNLKVSKEIEHQTIEEYHSLNADLIAALSRITYTKFNIYDIASELCHPVCMLTDAEGKPLYYDGGHLTLSGGAILYHVFLKVVDGFGKGFNAASRE